MSVTAVDSDAGVKGSKRRRSREITEEAIYTAAARLFAQNGYQSTTLEQIAKEVGVHKSTIFHYVTTKDELLAIVLDRGFRGYVESLEQIALSGQDGFTIFEAAVRNHLRFVFEHGTELKIFLRERQHLDSDRGRSYLRMKERYEQLFTSIVQQGMLDGTLRYSDPTLLCLFVLGAANSVVEWFREGGRLSADEVADEFLETVVAPTTKSPPNRPLKGY